MIVIENIWLFVTLLTANVIAVQLECPVTICWLFTLQSIVTVWLQVAGVYVFATSAVPAGTVLPVIVHQDRGSFVSHIALVALALGIVSSLALTLDRSVSNTPDFRLSTSIFEIVLLSAFIVLFVSVSVDEADIFASKLSFTSFSLGYAVSVGVAWNDVLLAESSGVNHKLSCFQFN